MDAQQLFDQAETLRTQGQGKQAAIKYVQAAKLVVSDSNSQHLVQEAWHMAGVSYKIENDIEHAMPCFKHALEIASQRNDKVGIGRIYRDIGIMYDYQKRYSDGLPYLQKSVEVLQATDATAELGITETKIGQNYLLQDDTKQAEQWLKHGLDTLEPTSHWSYIVTTLLPLAGLEFKHQHYQNMLDYLLRAEQLINDSNEIDNQTRRLIQIYGLMAHAYIGLGNKTKATQMFEQTKELMSIIETKSARDVLYEDIDYNKLKKELAL